jgi:glycerol-3-phosphate dehydrogenase
VQGSHVVVPKLFDHDRCYIFQNADGRIIFASPYEGAFTLIGTTDRDFQGQPGKVEASTEEIAYLCAAASEYFTVPVRPDQVVWTYSGVRPLYDDGSSDAKAVTRDYVLSLDAPEGAAALLSVFGGKITTFRRLAESALEKIVPHLPAAKGEAAGWTRTAPLPGGDFPLTALAALADDIGKRHPYLAPTHAARLARTYGTRAHVLLDGARSAADLGQSFGADLTEREVRYLMDREWAHTAEDVLWRRSKLGLRLTPAERFELDRWMRAEPSALAVSA